MKLGKSLIVVSHKSHRILTTSVMCLGMLDWDDTRIVFTKRELLNFLKLVVSIAHYPMRSRAMNEPSLRDDFLLNTQVYGHLY
jgi:hypothetical protein